MRLLLDEMFSRAMAQRLRERGHDVVAVLDAPLSRSPEDSTIFVQARREGRAVVTRDIGDYRLIATAALEAGSSHAGLVLVTDQSFPERDARTTGRLFTSLLALLEADTDIEGREYWLR